MTLRLAVTALLAGLALTGCGSDNGTGRSAGSTGAGAPAGATSTTGSSTPAARTAQARRGVRLVRIGRFRSPVYVTSPPGDRRRLMVVEQGGRIMVIRGGRRLARPFLDIRSRVLAGAEQGLLSVAFPPDYASSG